MANITNFLVKEANRITYDMTQRLSQTSVWVSPFAKKLFPPGMGAAVSNIRYERPYVETVNDFDNVAINDGTGNSCLPPIDNVVFHKTLRAYNLRHKAVESPEFCVNDLMFVGKAEQQMGAIMTALEEYTREVWIDFNRSAYANICTKYILTDTMTVKTGEGQAWSVAAQPTGYLTQNVLDYLYNILLFERIEKDAYAMSGSSPILALVTDSLTSRRIIFNNPDIREDFRQSSKSDSLLGPIGVNHTYGGYIHLIDAMPPRYNWDEIEEEWDEVEPWYLDESDIANPKREVNPEYLTAEFQDSYILTPKAVNLRVPEIKTAVGKAKFDPRHYMGEYSFVNIKHKTDNPDGTIGFFRGIIMAGHESVKPQYAIAIRHKVCSTLEVADCLA